MDKLIESTLRELIEPICKQQGIFFHNIFLHGKGNNNTIKVIVDTEPGITLKECTTLTKEINDLIYRKDLIQNNYRVEVSSPGTDKPLEEPYEYRRNIGRQLKLLFNDDDIEKEMIGKLIDYKNENVVLEFKNKIKEIPIGKIKYAKIKLQW